MTMNSNETLAEINLTIAKAIDPWQSKNGWRSCGSGDLPRHRPADSTARDRGHPVPVIYCPYCNGAGEVPLDFCTDWNALMDVALPWAREQEWWCDNVKNPIINNKTWGELFWDMVQQLGVFLAAKFLAKAIEENNK